MTKPTKRADEPEDWRKVQHPTRKISAPADGPLPGVEYEGPLVLSRRIDPRLAIQAVTRLGQGMSYNRTAKEVGISDDTVRRLAMWNREAIDDMQRQVRGRAVQMLHDRLDATVGSLLDTAESGEDRAKAQCARVAGELAGMIGKTADIHIGDKNVQVNAVDLSQRVELVEGEDWEETLERCRRRFLKNAETAPVEDPPEGHSD